MGSSHNADADFHQSDERRLRDVIKHLKSSCSQLQSSMLELESVHSVNDAPRDVTRVSSASSVVDLEQAVLVQELMAMKVTHCESIVCFCCLTHRSLQEEKSHVKKQNLALLKELASLRQQLRSNTPNTQPSDVTRTQADSAGGTATPSLTLAELRAQGVDASQTATELSESLKREELLRRRVAELVATLDRLSKNADQRHRQSSAFVAELRKANRCVDTLQHS